MGELALKKIQGGLETVRGTAVVATRNIYGKMTITRLQPRRFANEDRGVFTKYFRANPKLIDAGFKLESDVTFEDLPYFLETVIQGGISPTGSSAQGFIWTYNPDMTSDLLKSRTYYAGDDTVQWRGAFGVSDKLDITIGLEDAITFELEGFVQDWVPVTSGFLTTGFSAPGFQNLSDRTVESVMGYQTKLFVDPPSNPVGTTQRSGKFISAKAGVHLNNKKKAFGDNFNYMLQKLGRGEKDVECEFVFEGLNQQEFADHFNNTEAIVRIQMIGTPIVGSTFGTTNGAITTGAVFNGPIVTNALTSAIAGGQAISIGGQSFTVAPAGAAASATSVPIIPQLVQTPANIPTATTIMACKTVNVDLWGYWDTFVPGSRETNTTWGMKLVGVYDAGVGFDHRITVVNQNNLAAGIT